MTTERAAGLAAASYVIRYCNGDQAVLRELLYALDVLPDPDVARRHAHRTVVNSRPPLTEVRDQVLEEFLADHPVEEIAANMGRTVPVTRRLITSAYAAPGGYIADPDDRLAWMLANAPEYVRPAISERRSVA